MEQQWFGISRPWHQFIGQTFGKYTLIDYYNLPNNDPSNIPPVYAFSLSEGITGTKGAVKPRSSLDVTDRRSVKSTDNDPDSKIIKIEAFNILQLEKICK